MNKEELKRLNEEAQKGTNAINKLLEKLLESDKITNKDELKSIQTQIKEVNGESKKIK